VRLNPLPGSSPVPWLGRAKARTAPVAAADAARAPKSFPVGAASAVFVDVKASEVELTVDVAKRTAVARANVTFEQPAAGYPLVDLVPVATRVAIDGRPVDARRYRDVRDPHGEASWRVLEEPLPPGRHTLTVEYPVSDGVTFSKGGFELRTHMTDLKTRGYLEKYLPSSDLSDQFPLSLKLNVVGGAGDEEVIANGAVTREADGGRRLQFPAYFNPSALFLHVFPKKAFHVERAVFEGLAGPLPMTVYADDAQAAKEVLEESRAILAELEEKFGPYPHETFIVHLTGLDGGMEYAGAIRTSRRALRHELAHLYFGRSVMPASGNDGWLDEAIASWIDEGYPRARSVPMEGSYPNLAGFSAYRRETSRDAYSHGLTVMKELDHLLRDTGGLAAALRELHDTYGRGIVTTQQFQALVQRRCNVPLADYFARKVYGGKPPEDAPPPLALWS
jgi:hypothetical protein